MFHWFNNFNFVLICQRKQEKKRYYSQTSLFVGIPLWTICGFYFASWTFLFFANYSGFLELIFRFPSMFAGVTFLKNLKYQNWYFMPKLGKFWPRNGSILSLFGVIALYLITNKDPIYT